MLQTGQMKMTHLDTLWRNKRKIKDTEILKATEVIRLPT